MIHLTGIYRVSNVYETTFVELRNRQAKLTFLAALPHNETKEACQ